MWPTTWQVVLWISLILYFGVAAVVAVGGIADIIRMFKRIDAEHQAAPPQTPGGDPEDAGHS